MNLTFTPRRLVGAASLIAALGLFAIVGGCSVFSSIGSVFHSHKGDDEQTTPDQDAQFADASAPTQFTYNSADNNVYDGFGANGLSYVDPFVADASQTQPIGSPFFRQASASGASMGTPGLSVFGEITSATMGPTPTSGQHAGDDNLDQISFAFDGADFDPDVSPDGTFLLFASTQHTRTADIFRKSVRGHTLTQLTSDPANDVMPALSPDGSRIAYASDRSGSWNIYIMNDTGGQSVQFTTDSAPQLHPTWSPDGAYIAYCRLGDTSGRWELWVADVANPAIRHFIGYGLLPKWSPVGGKIVFQRSRQQGDRLFSIWTLDYINGEGRNPTEIISSPSAAMVNPSFSPDGQRLAFAVIPNPDEQTGDQPDIADLWIVNIDGSDRANLTGGLYANITPTWGPDHRIYFISDRSGTDNIWALRPGRAILAAQSPNMNKSDLASSHNQKDAKGELATVPDDPGGN